jgi:energy-coupling factor transport system permease protein
VSKSLVSYYPGTTLIHRLDPRAKLLFLLVLSVVIFSIQDLLLAIFVFLSLCALWIVAKLPVSIIWSFVRGLLPVFIFLVIVQAILYPGEKILIEPLIPNFIPGIGGAGNITLEGILFAILLMFRLISMLTSALNMVPILQSEIASIVDAQKLRAMQTFEKGKLREKLRSYPALVTPLVIGAMRRAQSMAVAMDSRAFGAFKTRTYIEDVQLESTDWIFMFCVVLYSVAVFQKVNCWLLWERMGRERALSARF